MSAAKLDQIATTITDRREEVDRLGLVIVDLEQKRAVALDEAARKSPGQLSAMFAAGGSASQIEKRLQEKRKRLEHAEMELPALERAHAEALAEEAEARREEYAKRCDRLREREKTGWREFGRALETLIGVYFEQIVPCAQELCEIQAEGARSGLFTAEERAQDWRRTTRTAVGPFPADFEAAFERAFQTMADPDGAGTRRVDGKRLDSARLLVELLPDLTSSYSHPKLDGLADKVHANRRAAAGYQAHGFAGLGFKP